MKTDVSRLMRFFAAVSAIGLRKGKGVTRLAFTETERKAAAKLKQLVSPLSEVKTQTDEFGNLIIRCPGSDPKAPVIAIGSHIDTVPNGGRFDGALGVCAGVEVLYSLHDAGISLRHPLEVLALVAEESSRFNCATSGSKAMMGRLNLPKFLRRKDARGITAGEALGALGFRPKAVRKASRLAEEFHAYLELHVEQGSVLEHSGHQLGVVSVIAAPIRLEVTFLGEPNHSGATTMDSRKDALAAASEFVLAVREIARQAGSGAVATVTDAKVEPGMMNVVPGKVTAKLDIRDIKLNRRQKTVARIESALRQIGKTCQVRIDSRVLEEGQPAVLSPKLSQIMRRCARELGVEAFVMPSGAGHDAAVFASSGVPSGLLFIPSRDGLSHNPKEYSSRRDIALAAQVLLNTVVALDDAHLP